VNDLVNALFTIASYPSGGFIREGTAEFDRDRMIHLARLTLMGHYKVGSWGAVLARLNQEDRG